MLDVGSSELLLIVIVAIVVIGPKDLPRALYKVGQLIGKARSMSRHFRSGIDAMIREVELEEMEKKWAAENRRIMEQYPSEPETPVEEAAPEAEALPPPPEPAEPEGVQDAPVAARKPRKAKAQAQPSLPLDGEMTQTAAAASAPDKGA